MRPTLANAAPLVLSALALAGIGWRLWARSERAEPAAVPAQAASEPAPPPAWRCGVPDERPDCFVRLPGGTLTLGAQADDPEGAGYDPDAQAHEGPVRTVTLAPFWLQRTEATVATFLACVQAGACDDADGATTEQGYASRNLAADNPAMAAMLPLNHVTWTGADATCRWLGGHLPSEDEWEFAARGGQQVRWPWGDVPRCPGGSETVGGLEADPTKWSRDCTADAPWRVGTRGLEGPFQLADLAGNLWEWTADVYGDGPARAQRGGSFLSGPATELRVTVRGGMAPDVKLPDVGFRCAFGGTP